MNSFGGRLQATLRDVDGRTWRYTHTFPFQIDQDDECYGRAVDFNLRRIGD